MTLPRHKKSLALVLFIIFIALDSTCSKYINRPKRQNGANMYLSASYVVPGGEENDEGWGPWSSPSSCSRSCGGGVAYQERECLLLDYYGRSTCQGGNRKYFSCNTQDCPDGSRDFRAEQCSRFDNIPFDKNKYTWVPYTRAPNPCELNCMPPGERFYYRHKQKVTDGTRCNDDSFDVCVDGQCLPVGCDRMLGSSAREDKCRKCGGDGSDCKTVEGSLSMDNLKVGYNDVLLIPANATNIDIKEMAPSSNYLACRNLSGHYYLNGNWRIDFPRPVFFAGAWWHYNRKQEGFFAPDQLTSLGPTNEPIYLVLLYQDKNVGIKYEYSIPLATALSTVPESYNWTFTEFTPCSVSCGGGVKTRNVTCNKNNDLELVDDSLCDQSEKPADQQTCGHSPCPPKWVEGEWSNCTKPCGDGGTQERTIKCKRVAPNGKEMIVPDEICLEDVGTKPSHIQECNVGAYCPKWHIGKWKACNKLCGDGVQTRQVVCYTDEGGKKQVVEDEKCPEIKPENEKPCILRPCEGVDWIITEWSGCDSCGLTQETRTVICASKDGKVFNDTHCLREKPTLIRPCEPKICNYQWFTSEWSNCSARCGEGVKTRIVFCAEMDGSTIKRAEDASKCEKSLKPNDSEKCVVEKENCPGQLFSGPWDVCSKKCGGGTQTRHVFCMIDNQKTDTKDCPVDELLSKEQSCNTNACTKDDLLQVNATGKPIVEDDDGDYDDMCDEDDTSMGTTYKEKSGDLLAEHTTIDFGKTLETEASLITDHLMMFTSTSNMPLSTTEGSGFEGSGSTENIFESSLSTIEPTETSSDVSNIPNQTETSDGPKGSTGTEVTREKSDSTTFPSPTATTTTGTDGITPRSTTSVVVTESATTGSSGETESSSTEIPKSTSGTTDISADTEAFKATTDNKLQSGGTTVTTDESTGKTTQTGVTAESSSKPTSLASEDTTVFSSSDLTVSDTATTGTDGITLTSPSSEVVTESAMTSSSGVTESSITEAGKSTTVTTDISADTEASKTTTDDKLESGGTTITTDQSTDETTQTGVTAESSSKPTSEDTTVASSSDRTVSDTATTGTDGITLTSPSSEVVTESAMTSSSGVTESSITEAGKSTTVTTDISADTEASKTTTDDKLESGGTTITTDESTDETTQTGVTAESSSKPTSEDITVSTSSDSTVSETATAGTDAAKTSDGITLTSPTSKVVTESATTGSSGKTESSSTATPKSTLATTDISAVTEASKATTDDKLESGGTTVTTDESTGETTQTGVTAESSRKPTSLASEHTTVSSSSDLTVSDTATTGTDGITVTSPTSEVVTESATTGSSGVTESSITEAGKSTSVTTDISADTEASKAATDDKLESGGTTVTTDESTGETTQTGVTAESSSKPTSEDITVSTSSDSTVSETATAGTDAAKTSDGITLTSPTSEVVTESATTGISGETESSSTAPPKSTLVTTDISAVTEASKATTGDKLESGGTTVTTDESTGETTQTGVTAESSSKPTSLASGDTTVSTSSDSTVSETATAGTDAAKTSDGITLTSPTSKVVTESATTGSSGETESSSTATPKSTLATTDISAVTEASKATTDDKLESGGTTVTTDESTGETTQTGVTAESSSKPTSLASGDTTVSSSSDRTVSDTATTGTDAAKTSDGITLTSPTSEVVTESSTTGSSGETESSSTEIPKSTSGTTDISAETGTVEATTDEKLESGGTSDIWAETTASEGETTSPSWITEITKGPRKCKRPTRKPECLRTKFGCCADNKTAATGPFGSGCEVIETCQDTEYGCCVDGVSPAQGPNEEGCPEPECTSSIFGCCPDKITPAEGEDNEGCPEIPTTVLTTTEDITTYSTTYSTTEETVSTTLVTEESTTVSDYTTETDWSTLSTITSTDMTEYVTEEPCVTSEFGCCPDNRTQANGPDFGGCVEETCFNSVHGCCSDNKTVAQGPNEEGCPICIHSEFGCCPDGITPAHGHFNVGCCLTAPYGCCPDNINSATGPEFEGCNCDNSSYGCCNDQKTPALGPNLEGCPCEESSFGCCPDKLTPALGPEFEGCPCHTFQFGCCPDGVTVANANKRGCDCLESEFKCCSDGKTPAKGPNMAGCNCATSEFGCCPDGVTEAKGHKFDGCNDTVEPIQKACGLPSDGGSCTNYSIKFYYDAEYGACSRFWYGGCEGNGNRFESQQECIENCVNVVGKGVCFLPMAKGQCNEFETKYYFDSNTGSCQQFEYGGCFGNPNRFNTFEECQSTCIAEDTLPSCEQPVERGPCDGDFDRWYFNNDTLKCERFSYGGCKGNKNNYPTEQACNYHCRSPGIHKAQCSLPRDEGNCHDRIARWHYSESDQKCMPFYYSGCGGNGNSYSSLEECDSQCPRPVAKDICELPAEQGECADWDLRWYYDTKERQCQNFYYGQCGGNENNFRTSEACEERCAKKPEGKPEVKPEVEPEVKPDLPDRSPTDVFDQKTCFLPNEPGQCDQYSVKWYYNSDLGLCDEFQYGGCGGNANRFETAEDCEMSCVHARETCTLPPVFGRCLDNQTRWYYDSAAGNCFEFPFSGCRGNKNNFMTQDKCLKYCKEESEPTQSPPLDPRFDPENTSTCDEPVDQGNCADWVLTYFYNKTSSRCERFYYGGCGGNRNNFASDEQCNRECGEFKNIDVCRQDVDPGRCSDRQTKWFYDQEAAECRQFDYSGCYGNGNRFATQEECQTVCVKATKLQEPTTEDICRLPVHNGDCIRLEQVTRRWYYDETRGTCAVFIYTGCGGNNNNFKSFQNCIDFCSKIQAPVPTQHTTTQHDLCENYRNACENLHCPYGVRRFYSFHKCEVCECVDPCAEHRCPNDHQCIVDRGPLEFIPVCRKMNKPGDCPVLPNVTSNCEHECENDAFCRDEMKCCSNGCSFVCTHPAEKEITTTAIPYVPGVDPRPSAAILEPKSQEEIDVNTPAGGLAILRCFATGHPLPTVTWKRGSIDTKHGRYVLSSTGDLNIIQVVRADSGNYVCVADNGLGTPVTREVRLDVTDPRPTGVYIVAPLNSTQVATINQPVILRCPAGGYPKPQIRWWRGKTLLPLKTNNLELMRDYSLLIHRVQYSDLGQYTCEGYAGSGRPRAIYIMLKAYRPPYITNQDYMTYSNFLVDPPLNEKSFISKPTSSPIPIVPVTQPHYLPDIPARLEPVVTVLSLPGGHTFALGSDIVLECDVKGYPTPTVVWTRNDLKLLSSERVSITDNPHRLIIHRGNIGDTGRYRCSASNEYSQASHEETVDVRVDPECKDNPFFANCALIVKGNYCHNQYYAKFCCRSCTLAGQITGTHPNAIS